MNVYSNKTLEELRFEDYNRFEALKNNTETTTNTANGFVSATLGKAFGSLGAKTATTEFGGFGTTLTTTGTTGVGFGASLDGSTFEVPSSLSEAVPNAMTNMTFCTNRIDANGTYTYAYEPIVVSMENYLISTTPT